MTGLRVEGRPLCGGDGGVCAKRVVPQGSPSAVPPPPDRRAGSENGANGAGPSCHHREVRGLGRGSCRVGKGGSCSLAPPVATQCSGEARSA